LATIEKAIEIAARVHAGVKDKHGNPYLLHPLRVMMGVTGERTQIVAVLHDVVEDTAISLADIAAAGFDTQVVDALALVTHGPNQSYADYVIGCKQNEIAREVKMSDLRDNASLARLLLRPSRLETDGSRIQRYLLSYQFLTDTITEDAYREAMQQVASA
jgi:hypothetical protein